MYKPLPFEFIIRIYTLGFMITSEKVQKMHVTIESLVLSKGMSLFHSIGENKTYTDRRMLFGLNTQLKII